MSRPQLLAILLLGVLTTTAIWWLAPKFAPVVKIGCVTLAEYRALPPDQHVRCVVIEVRR